MFLMAKPREILKFEVIKWFVIRHNEDIKRRNVKTNRKWKDADSQMLSSRQLQSRHL